jgi:hypothetical protein
MSRILFEVGQYSNCDGEVRNGCDRGLWQSHGPIVGYHGIGDVRGESVDNGEAVHSLGAVRLVTVGFGLVNFRQGFLCGHENGIEADGLSGGISQTLALFDFIITS